MSEPSDTERTAVHEAAHGLVAHRAGICVEEMTLRPGRTLFADVLDDDAIALAIYVAGACAERIAWPDTPAAFDHADRIKAEHRALSLAHDRAGAEALIDETTVRVTDMLVADWRIIEALAFALLTARPEHLDADAVRRIIKPSQRRPGGTTFHPPRPLPARGPGTLLPGSFRDGGAGSYGETTSTLIAVAV